MEAYILNEFHHNYTWVARSGCFLPRDAEDANSDAFLEANSLMHELKHSSATLTFILEAFLWNGLGCLQMNGELLFTKHVQSKDLRCHPVMCFTCGYWTNWAYQNSEWPKYLRPHTKISKDFDPKYLKPWTNTVKTLDQQSHRNVKILKSLNVSM